MATIRETLVLEERFAGTFAQYIAAAQKAGGYTKDVAAAAKLATSESKVMAGAYNAAAAQAKAMDAEQKQLASAFRASEAEQKKIAAASYAEAAASNAAAAAARAKAADLNAVAAAERLEAQRAKAAAQEQDRLNRSMRNGASAADGLIKKIASLAAAYVSLRSAQALIGLSDTWTQTTARLGMVNEKYGTDVDLSEMIRQSAGRSRSSYLDTADAVSKMALNAGAAFSAPEEVVAFMEQINKQFAIAGASATEQKNAMIQLTQAMAAGTLRGEELNSVLDQAPTIARSIEKYMDIAEGSIKSYAEKGLITAEVVKNAMLATAKETNAAFESIPLTFSQAMTMVKNEGLNALRPVLEELNAFLNSDVGRDALNGFIAAVRMGGEALLWLVRLVEQGAALIIENWDTVSTILVIGAIAVGAAMVSAAQASASAAVKSAVAWATQHPVLLMIAGGISLVIFMARQMGATWGDIGGVVGGVLYELFALGNNLIADAWNLIATFAEFFANVFNDPVAAIMHLFADLADWCLSILQGIASGIDAVFGSNLSNAVNTWRSGVQDWANSFGENEIKIQRMEKIQYDDAWDRGSQMGRSIGAALDNFNISDFVSSIGGTGFDYDALAAASGINSTLSEIGADTKAIKNSVALSEEDIKLLVDMATREYVNNINLTAQTPIINVTGQNTGDTEMDKRALADAIKDILIEESASHTDLAYT